MALRLLAMAILFFQPVQAQVTTSQYDNARTGATLQEKILNPRNVNPKEFGKLFALHVDGDVYAQPLYLPNLAIPGAGVHDTVFAATEHDSVYAFDAAGKPAKPLWRVSFIDGRTGVTTVPVTSAGCPFISPEVGITSTPVIDPHSGTLYVLARTKEKDASGTDRFYQRLHALDVLTGKEKFGGPVPIRGAVSSKGGGFLGLMAGPLEFLTLHENPRAALLLDRGRLFLTWGSSCDDPPYHGWVMAYDAHTLKQLGILNTSPDAADSGIWQSDTGPAADEEGNVFTVTGNGVFNAASGGRDYGDSVLKIGLTGAGLAVKDYFTPFNQAALNRSDSDLGSGGPLLIPQQAGFKERLLVLGGKGAEIYVLDRDALGKFHQYDNRNALQSIRVGGGIFGAPAYWNGHIYYLPSDDSLKDFALHGNRLSSEPAAIAPASGHSSTTPAVSANGSKDGIVWVIETGRMAVLHAYDASNIANELYDSRTFRDRDQAASSLHFTIPTVAGGRVYVPAAGEVEVFGLLDTK
ncbi:MAG TPA: hypothetical protein VGG97_00245 [Bryobacteraceae bacterium]